MSVTHHEVKFVPPNGEELVILVRWLVGPRTRVVAGQPLALFHSPLIPAPPPLISSSPGPISASVSSSSLANLLNTSGEAQALLQQQVVLSPHDGLINDLLVPQGDIITKGQTICLLRPLEAGNAGSPSKTDFGMSSEQLRGRDTSAPRPSSKPRFNYDPTAISQEIKRLDRKRRNLELDLRRKVAEEEYSNESNPIVLRFVTLDKELSARQTERRRELLDILRILQHRYDFLRSDRSSAMVDVGSLTHLCNELPVWSIAPLKYTVEAADRQNCKDILSWDGPDEEERDGEHAGYFLARATSTYPWLKSNDEREGDPICDYMAAHLFENRFILAIADGCNWGPAVALAAKKAATTFVRCVGRHHESFRTTQELGHCLLQGVADAHQSIMNYELDIFDSGTSTLLGGVLLQLNKLDDQGQNTWAFVFVSVGDCVARSSLVSLGNGLARRVEAVAAGARLAAWNPHSGRVTETEAQANYCTYKGRKACVRLLLDTNETLTLTPDHRVLATLTDRAGLQWIEAGRLTPDHRMLRNVSMDAIDNDKPYDDDDDDDDDRDVDNNEVEEESSASFSFGGLTLLRHRDALLALARLAAIVTAPHWSQRFRTAVDDVHVQRDAEQLGGWTPALRQHLVAFKAAVTTQPTSIPPCLLREYRAAQLGYCSSLSDLLSAAITLAAGSLADDHGRAWLRFARRCGVRYSVVKQRLVALLALYFLHHDVNSKTSSSSSSSSSPLQQHQHLPACLQTDYLVSLCAALLPATAGGEKRESEQLPCPSSSSSTSTPTSNNNDDDVRWCKWLQTLDIDDDRSSLLVGLRCSPVPIEETLPVYDVSVPGHENFIANSFVVHNCKAFIWSRATRKITDITENSRSEQLDPRDCGGRIGPYHHTGQPDLRNLAVYCAPCFEGDMLILCSDGVHDNLDPVMLGLSPSDLELTEESWEDVDPVVLSELKNRYRCEFLQSKIFGNLTRPLPAVVASRIINHCVETTSNSREFLERDPEANLPTDYANFPGKMDHTTCLCITATVIPRESSPPTAWAALSPKKPNMMRSTSSRLATSFRTTARRDKTASIMVDSPLLTPKGKR